MMKKEIKNMKSYELIVIGVSMGGLNAMKIILNELPTYFSIPIVVVQHREDSSDNLLVELLQNSCALKVVEIEDKMYISKGRVFVAPSGYHTLVEENHFSLSTEEPINFSRPSIDLLFKTAVHHFGNKIIGVILTGANIDGAEGLARIKNAGGLTIVQDPETSVSDIMPKAAIEAINPDYIFGLPQIARLLVEIDRWKIRHPDV